MTWSEGKSRCGEHETEPATISAKEMETRPCEIKLWFLHHLKVAGKKSLYEPIILHHDFPLPGTFSLSMPPLKGNRTYL